MPHRCLASALVTGWRAQISISAQNILSYSTIYAHIDKSIIQLYCPCSGKSSLASSQTNNTIHYILMKVGRPFSHFILLIFIFILFLILFAALVFHCPLLSVWLFNTLMVMFILSQHWALKAGERSRSWFHTEQVSGDLKHETWSVMCLLMFNRNHH